MSDDLIRREDAIKAVEERSFAVRDSYTVKAILRNVPSADRPSAVDLSSVYSTAYKSGYDKGYADAVQGIADEMVKQGKCIVQDRPQGEWILSDDRYWKTCSECGADVDVSMGLGIYVNNDEVSEICFCPNCGARMKGADDE